MRLSCMGRFFVIHVIMGGQSLTLNKYLAGSVALVALLPVLAVGPAFAQDAQTQVAQQAPQQAQQPKAQTQVIEVTGTRIKTADVDVKSANPVTVIGAEEISRQRASTVEDILRKQPALDFTGGITANTNNGGVGASNIGLRNLGPTRTLILVNGQRFVNTDTGGAASAVDLNNIPASFIDTIEILRDGAGSIYGADAIAGVVNIKLKKNFEGIQLDAGIGSTDKSDGTTYNTGLTFGTNFDKGNLLVNISQDHRDPILQKNRDFATRQFAGTDQEGSGPTSGRLPGLFGRTGVDIKDVNGNVIKAGTSFYVYGNGQIRRADDPFFLNNKLPGVLLFPDQANQGGRVLFDLTQEPFLVGGLERKQINLTGHYDIVPGVTAVLEGFYTNRTSSQQLNPEPLASSITTSKYPGFLIPAFQEDLQVSVNPLTGVPTIKRVKILDANGNPIANPGNPFGSDIRGASSRRFEGGDRIFKQDIDTYRLRFGLEGDLFEKYSYEVGYAYGRSSSQDRTFGGINFDHLARTTGQKPCGADVIKGCRIVNYFGDSTLSASDINYLQYTNTRTSNVTQDYVYGNIGGPVYKLPAGDVSANVGFEVRTEGGFDFPDSITAQGDSSQDASPSQGGFRVYSGYSELKIPVLKDLPFVKSLNLDASARYDFYTTFGRSLTYKAGIDYAVNDDIRFRFNQGTGFRAPQVKELVGGQFQNFPTITGGDPCSTTRGVFAGSPTCVAALQAAGLTAQQIKNFVPADPTPNPQIPTINGGNLGLKAEKSQQFTLGTVLTPRFIPNFSLTVDYYNIKIRNSITTLGTSNLLATCYDPKIQRQASCAKINRGPTGDISSVMDLNTNFGFEDTSGIDVGVNYSIDTDKLGLPKFGTLSFAGNVNYLLQDNVPDVNNVIQSSAGTFSTAGGSGEPRFKALLATTFSKDAFSTTFTSRYYGGLKNGPTNGPDDSRGNQTAGQYLFDISASYKYKNIDLTVGVDNLFDRDPPFIIDGATNSLTGAGYDYTGRFVYLKTKVTF